MFFYKVFNLILNSEVKIIHLPEASEIDRHGLINIVIKHGKVDRPADIDASWKHYFFCPKAPSNFLEFLLEFESVGRFKVSNGSEVILEAFTEDLGTLSTYLMGSVMGTLLHQRKYFVLHGNALVYKNQAHIFVGDSGAGKSTLAARFVTLGCPVLSDDVSALSENSLGKTMALPAYPAMKLWQDAADYLEINTEDCYSVVMREQKFHVPYLDYFCNESKPLGGIYILNKYAETFGVKMLSGMQKVQGLIRHVYMKRYLDSMGLSESNFLQAVELSKKIKVFQVDYPHTYENQEKLIQYFFPMLLEYQI